MTKRRPRRSSPTVANEQSLVPLLPRPLRSRKRECPDETVALSDNNQPRLPQQVIKKEDETQVLLPPETLQHTLQGCTESSTQFEKAGGGAVHPMQETIAIESPGTFTKEIKDRAVALPVHGETTESIRSSSYYNQSEEEKELKAKNYNNKPSPTAQPTAQPLPSMATPQEGEIVGGGGLTTSEEGLSQAENLDHQMKYSQQEEDNFVSAVDDTEAAMGLPAKKRRRMGMCGLTEKERSHFLQAQKRDTGTNVVSGGGDGRESPIIDNRESDVIPDKVITGIPSILPSPPCPSIPVERVGEQNETEMLLQSACPGREIRSGADTGGHISNTASERARHVRSPTVRELGCSEGETCQADPNVEPGPGQGSEPAPLAENEGHYTDKQLYTDSVLNKRKNQEGVQNSSKQLDSMAAPMEGVGVGGSNSNNAAEVWSKDTGSGPGDSPREEHSKIAATPCGSEKNSNCGPDENLGTSPSLVKQLQSENTHDSLGSWSLDYVSDSQLHDIVLNEEQVMKGDECGHEDATDLVCGLIRELSSLNRTVMTAHRELENMRRGNKGSRASIRRVFGAGPRHLHTLQ